ncbi:uncharacterized protein [Henckelia pumila]|uniref:uncharacterized protein n=1 Tax=Henckelia pumila TaxID=405737 RepID=UPI003C6DD196
MTANSLQFGTNRSDHAPRRGSEVNVSSLEKQLIDLTSLVRQMAVGNGQTMKGYGICNAMGHATGMCPTLKEESVEHVNATGGFPGPPQRKYDPYSNTYNPSLKDHPNLRHGNPQANQPGPQAPPHNQSYRHRILNIHSVLKFQRLLATTVNRLEALNSNSLPSQTVVNPRENVSAITLRSGKELKVNEEVVKEPVHNKDEQESKVEEDETVQMDAPKGKFPPFSEYKPVAPFPLALKESRKDEGIKGLYEVFRRCEVNIPLLDVIKQIPRYAKFLKELCTVKRKHKLKGCQKVELGEHVSAVIQRKVGHMEGRQDGRSATWEVGWDWNTRSAEQWFNLLQPSSIHSFNDCSSNFVHEFESSKIYLKISLSLFTLKQSEVEPLREFIQIFNAAAL